MKPGTGAITPMLTFPSATESTKTKDTSIKTQKCTLQMNTYILQVVCQKHGAVQLEIWNDGLWLPSTLNSQSDQAPAAAARPQYRMRRVEAEEEVASSADSASRPSPRRSQRSVIVPNI